MATPKHRRDRPRAVLFIVALTALPTTAREAIAGGLIQVQVKPAEAENPRLIEPGRLSAPLRAVAAARTKQITVITFEVGKEGSEEWGLVRKDRGRLPKTLLRRAGLVYPACLDISPDGTLVAVGVWEEGRRRVAVVELSTGALRTVVEPPRDRAPTELWIPCEVVFSPDGRVLAVGVQRAVGSRVDPSWVQLHDVASGALVERLAFPADLQPGRWDSRGLLLLSVDQVLRWTPAQPVHR